METLRIEIRKKTELNGTTYYNLYFNDRFESLSSKIEELQEKVKIAKEVFLNGKDTPEIILTETLTR